ncbi:MAG: DUF5668 domain-containing protein [candidate division Zixibacteria bacterium]|nr:DUF5668 domain-containing protein [candidate division Zixibacteria bacterium]
MTVSRIRNGVILLSVGIVLLLNNLDYVDWSVWVSILSLWPVLLIAIGIEKIFARTSLSFLAYLSPILLLIAILGPAYYFYNNERDNITYEGKRFRWEKEMVPAVKKGFATFDFKAGTLKTNASQDKLALAELDYWRRVPLCFYNYSDKDSIVRLEIKDQDHFWRGWFKPGIKSRHQWDVFLSDKIPWDLEIENSVMNGDLDFSGLILENLSVNLDASSLKIKLGNKSRNLKVKIDSDVSRLELLLPKDAGLKIENRSSLSSTNFEDISVNHERKSYWTSNYDSSPSKIEISIHGDVSSLKVIGY